METPPSNRSASFSIKSLTSTEFNPSSSLGTPRKDNAAITCKLSIESSSALAPVA